MSYITVQLPFLLFNCHLYEDVSLRISAFWQEGIKKRLKHIISEQTSSCHIGYIAVQRRGKMPFLLGDCSQLIAPHKYRNPR